jgi:membrane protease YdiL (CAAX protease family)
MHIGHKHHLVHTEVVASGVLLAVAGLWSAFSGIDLAGALRPNLDALAAGIAGGLALAATLPLVTARWARRVLVLRGLRRAWDALESGLGPGLATSDVVILAVCSAISEEVFFRGVLQPEIGLVAASAAFGLVHPLGAAYVAWAGAAGAVFGVLYLATGSLVAPAIAHGTYNLVALTYLRQRSARPSELP